MKKVFASTWYHPNGKWKLDEAIVVENEKITGSAVGGSFFFGPEDTEQEVLEEALLDLLFYDPEKTDEEWKKELEKLKEGTEVKFVSREKIEKLKEKYPEQD